MTLNINTEMYSKRRHHNPSDQYQTCPEADNYHLLECDTIQSGTNLLKIWRNTLKFISGYTPSHPTRHETLKSRMF
jgi:hypothetical protein